MSARWRYILQEAGLGLLRNLMMTFAVVLSVTVSLTLLGGALLLGQQVQLAADDWGAKVEVSIYLCDDRQCPAITPEQQETLLNDLNDHSVVEQVFYESKEDAYERFREMFANQPDLIDSLERDLLPASFRVKLHDPELFHVINAEFQAYPGVDEVVDQKEMLEQILSFARMIRFAAFAVAIIQLVAAGVLIGNTIRVAAFARREQTSIMKLVGASNWYVRLPFLLEGVFAGLLGALLSWGLLYASVPPAAERLQTQIEMMPFIHTSEVIGVGPWLLLAGVAISSLSSLLALRRFLDV
jgi:cell division transport system permease protein